MNIFIDDTQCWICGAGHKITSHHVIPKHFKPIKNMLIPLCKDCHLKVTSNDMASLSAFADLLQIETNTLNRQVAELKVMIKKNDFV